jgi:hypothetical protein
VREEARSRAIEIQERKQEWVGGSGALSQRDGRRIAWRRDDERVSFHSVNKKMNETPGNVCRPAVFHLAPAAGDANQHEMRSGCVEQWSSDD